MQTFGLTLSFSKIYSGAKLELWLPIIYSAGKLQLFTQDAAVNCLQNSQLIMYVIFF